MPEIDNWDEFAEKASEIYRNDPINSRFTMKYRHKDGKLNINATDNKKAYQYKAGHSKEVKNFDKFMTTVMRNMVNKE